MDSMTRKIIRNTLALLVVILVIVFAVLIFTGKTAEDTNCKDYSLSECPERCVICPPCEVCSSLVCQSEKFCEDLGFNKSWQKGIGY